MSIPFQNFKAEAFRAFHTAGQGFVIPNPWDAGTARLLEQLGFRVLATTSAALGEFPRAAHELRDHGTAKFAKAAACGSELNARFAQHGFTASEANSASAPHAERGHLAMALMVRASA